MRKLILLLAFLLIPVICFASPTEIITTGTYIMGDGETPAVAEERAFVAAKQAAVESAGSYIESYVQTQNWELTKDEVNVVASGVMQTVVLDKQRELVPDGGIRFTVKIRALVDNDGVEAMRDRLADRRLVEDYRRVQDAYAQSQQEIVQLQGKIANSNESLVKKRLGIQVLMNDYFSLAREHFYTGDIYASSNRDTDAIASYEKGILFCEEYQKLYLQWIGTFDETPVRKSFVFADGIKADSIYLKSWDKPVKEDFSYILSQTDSVKARIKISQLTRN